MLLDQRRPDAGEAVSGFAQHMDRQTGSHVLSRLRASGGRPQSPASAGAKAATVATGVWEFWALVGLIGSGARGAEKIYRHSPRPQELHGHLHIALLDSAVPIQFPQFV